MKGLYSLRRARAALLAVGAVLLVALVAATRLSSERDASVPGAAAPTATRTPGAPSPTVPAVTLPSATRTPPATARPPNPTTAAATTPSVAAPSLGKLAFVRGGDLFVQDLPDGVAKQLTKDATNNTPRWSASGDWLAFWKEAQVWVVRADGADARPLDAQLVKHYAWSPTADELAYTTGGELVVVRADGAGRRVLAVPHRDPLAIGPMTWSPDGRWIAFLKEEKASAQPASYAGLWVARADGGDAHEVYAADDPRDADFRLAGWSSDAHGLLFWSVPQRSASLAADGVPLLRVPVTGGQPETLVPRMLPHEDFLAPGPNGQLAFVDGGGRETWQMKRIAVVGSSDAPRVLSDSGRADLFPAWSHDGHRIAFSGGPQPPKSVGGGAEADSAMAQRRIWVMDADGANKRQLTNDPAYRDERPRWSADGSHILFARTSGEHAQLWLMRADGSGARVVVDGPSLGPGAPSGFFSFGYYGYLSLGQVYDWRTTP